MTLENEFTVSAIAELVRESCDEWYGDDTVLTDGVVEEFTKRLEKALDGKVLVEVEGAKEDEAGSCEHVYGGVHAMVSRPAYTFIGCLKCGEAMPKPADDAAAGEGETDAVD